MKNNKKGFTLIELLAVIVILAIIMVIAVPRILDVIETSRTSAWSNNLSMIANSLELNGSIINTTSGTVQQNVASYCTSKNLSGIADLDTNVTVNACTGNKFSISGGSAGQFKDKKGCVDCSASTASMGSCTVSSTTAYCSN